MLLSFTKLLFTRENFAALTTFNLLSRWRPSSMPLLFAVMTEKKIFLTLSNEIIKRCLRENVTPPVDLCVYLMELKFLQPSKNHSFVAHDETLSEALIKESVDYFKGNFFEIETLKLQLLWQKKYHSIDDLKKIHHERVIKNILPIMSEIVEDKPVQAIDKDVFTKKIVIFIIMFAGLGSPTQQSIIKETQAALLSILKITELENFLSLPKAVKEQQLVEFSRLITGILLFNKDCKKGGEDMDDLPMILTEGVRATKERLMGFKDRLDQKIDQLVRIILWGYNNMDSKEDIARSESNGKVSEPPNLQREKLEDLKTFLIYYRHIESYLNDLIKDLEKSFESVEELVERLQTTLLEIHSVVRYRVAVATLQVFPLFLRLSDIWVEMQEEVDVLSEINDNFVDLSLAEKLPLSISLEEFSLGETNSSSESVGIQESLDFYPGIKVCSISSMPNNENLQYKGFCAWTLASTEGVLITGNITLGVIHYSNRFYSFATIEGASKWALNPNHHIETVLEMTKVKYELIKFLDLEDDLIEKLSVKKNEKPPTAHVESQTELHPLESSINREYTFSEWELKRRIMKLVTLNRFATKSQQTGKESCFRKDTGVQVSLRKNVNTQTTRDASCNPLGIPRYVWSLKTVPHQFLGSNSNLDASYSI